MPAYSIMHHLEEVRTLPHQEGGSDKITCSNYCYGVLHREKKHMASTVVYISTSLEVVCKVQAIYL